MKNVIMHVPQEEVDSNPLLFLRYGSAHASAGHFSHAAKMQQKIGMGKMPVF